MLTSVADAACDFDLAAVFQGLDAAPAICLAVSGGPDSMALLDMAAGWRAMLPSGPRLHVATVDHGLRPEAAAEAAVVAAAAVRLGLPHATLRWDGAKPTTRVQARARDARYVLLGDHCRAQGVPILLTAHHGDDQAETVLMRLGRGSGLAGLAGMRRSTRLIDGTLLVRPLLNHAKIDLIAYCRRRGLAFVDDPSNHDDAFARARLRRQMPAAATFGLTPAALRRLARRMARADEAVDAEVARLWSTLSPQPCGEGCEVDLRAIRGTPVEIVQRLIGRLIKGCTGHGRLSLEKLETFADAVLAALDAGRAYRGTLGGACLTLDPAGRLTARPEPTRRRGRPRPD